MRKRIGGKKKAEIIVDERMWNWRRRQNEKAQKNGRDSHYQHRKPLLACKARKSGFETGKPFATESWPRKTDRDGNDCAADLNREKWRLASGN